jgi:hypothetical protein
VTARDTFGKAEKVIPKVVLGSGQPRLKTPVLTSFPDLSLERR